MSSRLYDFILTLADASSFTPGMSIYGTSSNALGEVIAVTSNTAKVKVSNVSHYYQSGETVLSNSSAVSSFYVSQRYTATPVVIFANTYAIDGSTNTFSLPVSADYKAEIQVFANNILVPQELYEFPSTTLGNIGIDFNLSEVIAFPAANDVAIVTAVTFPDASIDSLEIAVSRGFSNVSSFIAAATPQEQTTVASSTIVDIAPSNYIAINNSFEQEPIVRLYSIYYPGNWYPPTANGNPNQVSLGSAWPYPFPIRYAQIFGEDFSIPDYSITFQNNNYRAFPINYPGISISSDGSVGELNLELSSIDFALTSLVENPRLVGYNNTSSVSAYVNGDLVTNIDPRTVPGNALFDAAVVSIRGGQNVSFDYATTISLGEEWVEIIKDSRDLLGAVVEIKNIFASMLEFWPEYSRIVGISGNVVSLDSTAMYRVGDIVKSESTETQRTIASVFQNNTIKLQEAEYTDATVGDSLFIVNQNADENAYVENKFIVTKMNGYDDNTINFNLSNRTTNLLDVLPKRKFYRGICPWTYKGVECKYPTSGSGIIPSTFPEKSANGYFTANNAETQDARLDVCAKTLTACRLRGNIQNFGGFIGVTDEL